MKKVFYIISVLISVSINLLAQTDIKGTNNEGNKEKLLSAALYSSIDSIKTSINIDFGYRIFAFDKFEIRGYTSVIGYKLFDSNNPYLYMFGFGEKISFGGKRKKINEIEITRYGFCFFTIGWLGFNEDKSLKFLFTAPLFYEIGGGVGFNIFIEDYLSIIIELGGGINSIIGDNSYFDNIRMAGFGRTSIGTRYHFLTK